MESAVLEVVGGILTNLSPAETWAVASTSRVKESKMFVFIAEIWKRLNHHHFRNHYLFIQYSECYARCDWPLPMIY